MTFRVLYAIKFSYVYAYTTPSTVNSSDYKEVALVDAPDLEDLFREMNNVDGTETCCKLEIRSMSVGDVAIDESGEAHYCAGSGWEPVTVIASAPKLSPTMWDRLAARRIRPLFVTR